MSQPKPAIAIRDEEYNKIVDGLKKTNVLSLKNTDGNIYSFYWKKKDLFCSVNGKQDMEMEVMPQSIALKNQLGSFQSSVKQQIQKDNPNLTDDVAEAYADIMTEANESIKRLMEQGYSPSVAREIVGRILENEEELDKLVQETSKQAENYSCSNVITQETP